ncbi:hypothetical protein B0H67DRAFT_325581 [Lasiosphaeris hirsuta]|uniref:Cell wall mannoprotein PIR1-like C-terminal domain-containing protein n=1 Tax=Lasiosphaeris hirsuta TaxID=260670 RepID=A0AA40A2C8_9PEZI|nr:hypothetical protein B0H67DRAFT_325581 [Lasiosphaeris hirsuta]
MRTQVFALLAVVGSAATQAVTQKVAPTASAPAGCKPSVEGKFEISIVELGDKAKRDQFLKKRGPACSGNGILVAELRDGVVTDSQGRAGYVASNYQFQFDGPPQAGAIYTAGFTHCGNGSLALGGSTVFYQCRSGDFSNLYDRWWAEQCSPVEILVMPCGEGAADESTGARVVGTTVVPTTVVIPLSDGQPQVITTSKVIPLCQIGDGKSLSFKNTQTNKINILVRPSPGTHHPLRSHHPRPNTHHQRPRRPILGRPDPDDQRPSAARHRDRCQPLGTHAPSIGRSQ